MEELLRQIEIQGNRLVRLEQENDFLREQLRLLTAKIYGRKSERFTLGENPQLQLFDEPAEEEPQQKTDADPGTVIDVAGHKRARAGRKPLPEHLPRVTILHDVTEEEKRCDCGAEKSRIGEEVAEQLDIVPARAQVLRHVRPKYACRCCEGVEGTGPTVVIAPPPAQIIPKSIVSPGLLAFILTGKFADALPFYRQEGIFKRLGVEINRTSMCNWALQGGRACWPLIELLVEEILSSQLINIDETTMQVLLEPGRSQTSTSYMWVFRGGDPERPILVFRYHPGREGKVAADFLGDYQGFVQTDGYSGYGFLDSRPGVVHLGCWAHVRRKFIEVTKSAHDSGKKKAGVAAEAVERIRALYAIEREAAESGLDSDAIACLRQEKATPLLEAMHPWLLERASETPPKSLLGKALAYALGQWPRLSHYLKDGCLRMDNNLAENAIRPFVVGRKNWLFSGSAEGARASATIYSLIETAKANGLDPYWYLRHVFERLPLAKTREHLRALLPQHVDRELVAARASG
jgi:transposase